MNAEELFLQKYGNKITASESWVIRFAEEYAKLKVDAVLRQPDVIKSVCVDCKDEFEAQTERCYACENNKGFPM